MEVFSRWEYKRASTDLIAAKAGVSKGLLFYYFHNKRALYLETYACAQRLVSEFIRDACPVQSDDFFDRLAGSSREKMRLMTQSPFCWISASGPIIPTVRRSPTRCAKK